MDMLTPTLIDGGFGGNDFKIERDKKKKFLFSKRAILFPVFSGQIVATVCERVAINSRNTKSAALSRSQSLRPVLVLVFISNDNGVPAA